MIKTLLGALALMLALNLPAAETPLAPDALIRGVSERVLTHVRNDKDIQSGDQAKTLALVETEILPHFDFGRMTALAVGKDWRRATPEQKKAVTQAFQTLLVRSYSNALRRFKDHQISFRPLRMKPEDTEVIVRTDVRRAGTEPDTVDYTLYKAADGNWKVFDVAVANVSLITSYRDAFGSEIAKGGIDGLIASLNAKNAQNAGKGKAK